MAWATPAIAAAAAVPAYAASADPPSCDCVAPTLGTNEEQISTEFYWPDPDDLFDGETAGHVEIAFGLDLGSCWTVPHSEVSPIVVDPESSTHYLTLTNNEGSAVTKRVNRTGLAGAVKASSAYNLQVTLDASDFTGELPGHITNVALTLPMIITVNGVSATCCTTFSFALNPSAEVTVANGGESTMNLGTTAPGVCD